MGPDTLFLSEDTPRRFVKALVIGILLVAAGVAAIIFSPTLLVRLIIAVVFVPLACWTVVVIAEVVRRGRSRIRPFVLVTPVDVVRADYEHGAVSNHALADATDLKVVREYSSKQEYAGTRYTFLFPGK